MKAIERRISVLESKSIESEQAIEARKNREFLSTLTDEELYRLHDICAKTQGWRLPLTDVKAEFLDILRAKYEVS